MSSSIRHKIFIGKCIPMIKRFLKEEKSIDMSLLFKPLLIFQAVLENCKIHNVVIIYIYIYIYILRRVMINRE